MELAAQKREPGKANTLRKQGHIPGVVYNKETNIPVSVELRAFDRVFRSRGTSQVVDLDVGGDKREVLVKAVQMDKRRRIPQHVDFYEVTAGQTVEVSVRIEILGTPLGVKEGGLMDVQKRDVLINVLPRLIPDQLVLDVSALTIGDSLHVSSVIDQLPSEAEVLDDIETTLVAVVPPPAEEELEPEEEVLEPELIGREGEEGEEGEEGDVRESQDQDADDE